MGISFRRSLQVWSLLASVSVLSRAQQAAPRPLITRPIDEAQLVRLDGNTHPLAHAEFDLGQASPDLPMQRMLLVLKRSPQQDSALRKLLDDQQDKTSSNYHKWLTPDEFGNRFGNSDQDIQLVMAWLQAHGFQVNRVSRGRSLIEFSGVEAQIEETFHTQIHRYMLANGEQHSANASDPQIPAALAPAVAGVWTLHNFYKKPQLVVSEQKVSARAVLGSRPQFTSGSGQHALAPADFYKIYNVSPQFGGGPSIAIVGRSNINVQDVVWFHYWTYDQVPMPNVVVNGPDPGDLGGAEEIEALLDTTWSGAVAPDAWVTLVVSASTNTTDGVDLSEAYIIDNNFADVMSESFGDCEAHYTSAQAAGIAGLAQQAAAQGITYVVASGDSGAAGCDNPSTQTTATHPASVNVLAATPYNVAVGGTMFNENGHNSTYWSSTTNQTTLGSALSYIPEDAWNQSCSSAQCGSKANIWAAGGGASGFFTKPSWQTGVAGIPADNARDVPDVSLTAATHDPYLLCVTGSCVPDAQGNIHFYAVGGTSASTPAFAGIMAMVGAKTGSRQGQANYVLYRLAAGESLGQCNASNAASPPASTCIFNDVTRGNNAVPGEPGYGTASALYQSGTGYDLATGLGSVNVTNLVNQWNTVTFSPTSTAFSISPTTAVHGSPLNVNGAVKSNSVTGTPTGPVWLVGGNPHGNLVGDSTVDIFTLDAQASFAGVTHILPGGTYQVNAHYAGDGTYGGSDSSPPIQVTIQPESTTITFSVLTKNSSGNLVPFTSGPYGTPVYYQAHVSGQSGYGVPGSYVNFWDNNGYGAGSAGLDAKGNAQTQALQIAAGMHSITAGYYGDNSFSSSVDLTPINFTITHVGTSTGLTSQQTAQSLLLTATVAASGTGSPPTGLITFTSGGTTLGTISLSNGSTSGGTTQALAVFDATQLAAGPYNVTASYAGDGNYTASTSAPVTLNLVADFTVANRGITSQTVSAGVTATYINDLAVTPFFEYSSTVTVSCAVPAQGTACTVNPSSYALAGGTGIGTISVTTTGRGALTVARTRGRSPFRWPLWPVPVSALSLLVAMVLPGRMRQRSSVRRPVLLLLLMSLSILAIGLSGCGGGGTSSGGGPSQQTGTPAGTYTVTATGTSGSISHSTNFTLIVQ
jgi:hypothetical protein